jgi:hypothetical protein
MMKNMGQSMRNCEKRDAAALERKKVSSKQSQKFITLLYLWAGGVEGQMVCNIKNVTAGLPLPRTGECAKSMVQLDHFYLFFRSHKNPAIMSPVSAGLD